MTTGVGAYETLNEAVPNGVLDLEIITSTTATTPVVIAPGISLVNAETYNGAIPGPTLHLTQGETAMRTCLSTGFCPAMAPTAPPTRPCRSRRVLPPTNEEDAAAICEIVDDPALRKDCVFDVATTRDESFAKAYAFAERHRREAVSVRVTATPKGEDGHSLPIIVATLSRHRDKPKGHVRVTVDGETFADGIELEDNCRAVVDLEARPGAARVQAEFVPAEDRTAGPPTLSPPIEVGEGCEDAETSGGTDETPGEIHSNGWLLFALILIILLAFAIL